MIVLLCAGVAFLSAMGTPRAKADARPARTLTFADRVAYQYAIEEVYWRHRTWPKENPGPKPSLDTVVAPGQIERNVEEYLGKSRLVAEQRGSPVTARELQTEMDRMAAQTKQPEVLHELFAALGNDPFVVAECLARPILSERLVAQFNHTDSESSRAKARPERKSNGSRDPVERRLNSSTGFLGSARNDMLINAAYKLPEISVPLDCADNTWVVTSANALDGRWGHTAVWTGNEMIIWGGENFSSGIFNTGASYDPGDRQLDSHRQRAGSPNRSYSGMDGQRNDRVGGRK